MNRRRRRKIILISTLTLLLLLLGLWFWNYNKTRSLGFTFEPPNAEIVTPPEYLYSFSGTEADRLARPIGVLVDGQNVYVADSRKSKIYQFDIDGDLIRTFGEEEVTVPLYIAKNPKTGELYVSDRRKRMIHIFKPDGEYVGEFDPKLPEEQLPKFDTKGVKWAPVALDFAPDGSFYVTEILHGHRLLMFDAEGKFEHSVGTVGIVLQASEAPEVFQFPNGVEVHGEEVWVADSNNRRIQVFSRDGEFKRLIPTEGLPRGFSFLPRRSSEDTSTKEKFVVIDTLAHDGTIWNIDGEKILNFGTRGVLEGQFNYPTSLAVGPSNRMFVTDTANGRVQVWGWPEELGGIVLPQPSLAWLWCLTPLLLLPLLLLFRRRRFFASRDFVEAMYVAELVTEMPDRKRRWFVMPDDYELLKGISQGEVDFGELLDEAEYSESDANALMERLELDKETAAMLAVAQRSYVFCTENEELRRVARLLEIDVVNCEEFVERFTSASKEPGDKVA